ncbi:hypothetical protein Pyrde_1410 [Pyrodictium delaneyi]|uniref:Uncharacterized protein n=1 Tax=Pyrodictium delaneyi TaxID=1273541 RepID=A0A0P0N4B8_9CREN|nr:hypothetical protein [Pyrodictium delaneyi]ALL01456.1 hypothetical protein Pyrde_1410 [Pyrodictium delaneyi]OWJ54630.1 hypothetical protein Pdsh_06315 [Pyrodictium delaneyi]
MTGHSIQNTNNSTLKKTALVLLIPLLLLPQLPPALAPAAHALTPDTSQLLVKRAILAWLDNRNRLQLNITEINNYIDLTNITPCTSCTESTTTCPLQSANLSVAFETLYEYNTTSRDLKLIEVTLYNETFSYQYYLLLYRAEHDSYNVTIATKIITDPETGEYKLFMTAANIAPIPEKTQPIADMVFIANETTLSQHYAILAKTLKKVAASDTKETKWLWNKIAKELDTLAKLVEKKLKAYNKSAAGLAIVLDGDLSCILYCILCGAALGAVIGCAIVTAGAGLIACLAEVFGVSSEAVLAALYSGAGVIFACVECCCCIGYQSCCDL